MNDALSLALTVAIPVALVLYGYSKLKNARNTKEKDLNRAVPQEKAPEEKHCPVVDPTAIRQEMMEMQWDEFVLDGTISENFPIELLEYPRLATLKEILEDPDYVTETHQDRVLRCVLRKKIDVRLAELRRTTASNANSSGVREERLRLCLTKDKRKARS